ncbi:MAG: hypothetical protein AAF970_16595 [Bacteroidota bacterium]
MTRTSSLSLCFCLAIGLLVGCTDQAPAVDLTPEQVAVEGMSPFWTAPQHVGEMRQNLSVSSPVSRLYFDALRTHGAQDWQRVDAAIQEHLDTLDDDRAYLAEQRAAYHMLVLLDEACLSDCAEARGRYLRLYVEAGGPDARIAVKALSALGGAWSSSEIDAVQAQAVANADTWLARERDSFSKRGCVDCTPYDLSQQDATLAIADLAEQLR